MTFGIEGKRVFNVEGFTTLDDFITTALDTEDRLLVLSNSQDTTENTFYLRRYLSNGGLDENFGEGGMTQFEYESFCNFLNVFNNNEVIVGCGGLTDSLEEGDRNTFKFSDQGMLDNGFGENGFLVDATAEQIQQGHRFFSNSSEIGIEFDSQIDYVRYYANGEVDRTFEFEGYFELVFFQNMKLDREDRLLVTATTIWFSGEQRGLLLRYNNSPLSIDDFEINEVTVYPNPSTDIFTISNVNSEQDYTVFALSGEQEKKGFLSANTNIVDLSGFASGIYVLQIGSTSKKLVKI